MKKLLFILLTIICFTCISCDDDSYRGRIVDIRKEPAHMIPYGYNNLYRGIPETYKIIVVNYYKKNRKHRAFSYTIKDPAYQYHIGDSVFLSLGGTLEVVETDKKL
jgi:hypothetical protein